MTDERPPNVLREARLVFREQQIDPRGELPSEQRRALALEADRAFFKNIGLASGRARRARVQRLAELEAAAAMARATSGEPLAS